FGGDQLVANFGGAAREMLETIVAHGAAPVMRTTITLFWPMGINTARRRALGNQMPGLASRARSRAAILQKEKGEAWFRGRQIFLPVQRCRTLSSRSGCAFCDRGSR